MSTTHVAEPNTVVEPSVVLRQGWLRHDVRVAAVVVTTVALFTLMAIRPVDTRLAVVSNPAGPVDVVVRKGATGSEIAKELVAKEVVAKEKEFIDVCQASTECKNIRPGVYAMKKHMGAAAALEALVNPTIFCCGLRTVVPGWTAAHIVEKIAASTGIPASELNEALADPVALGEPADAIDPRALVGAEGWLFPGTYDVDPGTPAGEVLIMMVERTKGTLTEKGVPQDQWLRVLTLASIVEREVGNCRGCDQYRPMVARAMENRLSRDMPLQADATTAYSLNKSALDLTGAELADKMNPYNTRAVRGLPPGPIASPSEASIDAVLNPAEGSWVFWCTVNLNTGETKFTDNYNEFLTFKRELNDWLKTNSPTTSPDE